MSKPFTKLFGKPIPNQKDNRLHTRETTQKQCETVGKYTICKVWLTKAKCGNTVVLGGTTYQVIGIMCDNWQVGDRQVYSN